MQSPDSQKIVARFFEALKRVIADGHIRGKATFTREHNKTRA